MNGPRSNFSLLPYEVRVRIISLLHDGAMYDAVITDPVVAEKLSALGIKLTRSAVSRVRKTAEYKRVCARREEMRRDLAADRLTAGILKESDAAESIGENVKVDLLRVVRDCVAANPDDIREVERLVRSAVSLTDAAKDNRISALQKKLEQEKRNRAGAEEEWANREAELLLEIKTLRERVAVLAAAVPGVEMSKVADAMDAQFGV